MAGAAAALQGRRRHMFAQARGLGPGAACPADVQGTVASFEPSYMTFPLPDDGNGLLAFEPAREALEGLLDKADVLAVGPGLGQSEGLAQGLCAGSSSRSTCRSSSTPTA